MKNTSSMDVKTLQTYQIISGIRSNNSEIIAWVKESYLPIVRQYLTQLNWTPHDAINVFERTLIKVKQQIQFNRNIKNKTFKAIFEDRLQVAWLEHIASFMPDALVNTNEKRKIIERFTKSIFPIVCSMVEKYKGDVETAKEIYAEAIWRVGKNIRDNKYEESNAFKTYFLEVVKNILREESRKKAKEVSFDDYFTDNEPADDFDFNVFKSKDADLTLLEKLLQQAEEKCIVIFNLFYWEGLKVHKIAEQTGLSLANAKQRLSRCRRKLKAAFINKKNKHDE